MEFLFKQKGRRGVGRLELVPVWASAPPHTKGFIELRLRRRRGVGRIEHVPVWASVPPHMEFIDKLREPLPRPHTKAVVRQGGSRWSL